MDSQAREGKARVNKARTGNAGAGKAQTGKAQTGKARSGSMKNMIGTVLPGMRRARGKDGFRSTRQPSPGSGEGIVPAILALARDGNTMVDIAAAVGMPVAFVRQVIESAAEDGRIDVASWRGTCASGTCTPQPASLLCAGCPFRPRDSR
ncbi:hypothetical protein [Pseudoscardovia suis]